MHPRLGSHDACPIGSCDLHYLSLIDFTAFSLFVAQVQSRRLRSLMFYLYYASHSMKECLIIINMRLLRSTTLKMRTSSSIFLGASSLYAMACRRVKESLCIGKMDIHTFSSAPIPLPEHQGCVSKAPGVAHMAIGSNMSPSVVLGNFLF